MIYLLLVVLVVVFVVMVFPEEELATLSRVCPLRVWLRRGQGARAGLWRAVAALARGRQAPEEGGGGRWWACVDVR